MHTVSFGPNDDITCTCGAVIHPTHREGWWWGERWNVAQMHAETGTLNFV